MTEDAKAAIAIAEALSDLLRRQMIDEESAQGLVLAMRGRGRLEENLGERR